MYYRCTIACKHFELTVFGGMAWSRTTLRVRTAVCLLSKTRYKPEELLAPVLHNWRGTDPLYIPEKFKPNH